MEAMASSTPVIATEVGGVPELLEHGVTALLVPAEDEITLRRKRSVICSEIAICAGPLPGRARAAVCDLTTTSWTDEYLAMIERRTR